MSEKKNVLVFSGSTYPAMQIIDCLKSNLRFHVVAAASYPNHSEFVCDDTVNNLPYIIDPGFLDEFISLVKEKKIDLIIPTDDSIALKLMENSDSIPATLVCSPYETAKLCRHKSLTYEKLEGKTYIPTVYKSKKYNEIEDFPVFAKPDDSQGGRGAKIISKPEDFYGLGNLENYVITEYLPGDEYTVDCFTDKAGKLIYACPRIRARLMNGITAHGYDIEYTNEFRSIIEDLNNSISFRGYWFAQLKRDVTGKLKLMEICTRFAGSFGISKSKGVNLPLMALCDFSGLDANVIVNDYQVTSDKTYIERYELDLEYDKVYIDYDDTITYKDGKTVNPYVMAYLYQCKYKSRKIILITRHFATFGETLQASFKRLCLANDLFDEIIELKWEDKKSDFINDKEKAIFIDNSFAERLDVSNKIGMPVFDVCNIDCLFDWRE